jgi:hypothetical protein
MTLFSTIAMQELISKTTVPSDGYRYLQPETETWIRGGDYFDLFEKVKAHRKANNIPSGPLWREEVEDQLCRQLPPGSCKNSDPRQTHSTGLSTRMDWGTVQSFTTTMATWAKGGVKTVSEGLANARAGICRSCYYNVSVPGCRSCTGLLNLALQVAKGKRLLSNRNLRNCAVCKCHLPVKVWFPIEAIAAGTSAETLAKYPDFCWIKKEIEDGMGTGKP